MKLGIEKILLKNNLLIANFISDPGSEYYRSSLFVSVMNYVNHHQKRMSVKQKGSKLSLTITEIRNVKSAIDILQNISMRQIVNLVTPFPGVQKGLVNTFFFLKMLYYLCLRIKYHEPDF